MSSKHDADNHSNQLNPNNDAYRSSRSGNYSNDDDDARDGKNIRYSQYDGFVRKPPVRQGFILNFVSMCGKVALIQMTAEVDKAVYRGGCIDVAEHIFDKLRIAFLKECGSEIAFSQLQSDEGVVVESVGQEFNPDAFFHSESAQHIKTRALWEAAGKMAVQTLKNQLKDGSHKARQDIGVVNPQQLQGYRYRD